MRTVAGTDLHQHEQQQEGRGSGSGPGGRVTVGLSVVAAVFFTVWLGARWINPGLDPITAYVSELAAQGQPFAHLFRTADAIAAVALVSACAIVIARHRRASRAAPAVRDRPDSMLVALRTGDDTGRPWIRDVPFALLALFGLATLLDAFSPLSCTPTADLACRIADEAGTVPLPHRIHEVTSSIAGTFAAIAMMWTVWFTRGGHAPTLLRTAGTALAAVHLVALAWSLVEIAQLSIGVGVLGLAQRISLLALVCWWVVLMASADGWHGAQGRRHLQPAAANDATPENG